MFGAKDLKSLLLVTVGLSLITDVMAFENAKIESLNLCLPFGDGDKNVRKQKGLMSKTMDLHVS